MSNVILTILFCRFIEVPVRSLEGRNASCECEINNGECKVEAGSDIFCQPEADELVEHGAVKRSDKESCAQK